MTIKTGRCITRWCGDLRVPGRMKCITSPASDLVSLGSIKISGKGGLLKIIDTTEIHLSPLYISYKLQQIKFRSHQQKMG